MLSNLYALPRRKISLICRAGNMIPSFEFSFQGYILDIPSFFAAFSLWAGDTYPVFILN